MIFLTTVTGTDIRHHKFSIYDDDYRYLIYSTKNEIRLQIQRKAFKQEDMSKVAERNERALSFWSQLIHTNKDKFLPDMLIEAETSIQTLQEAWDERR